MTTVSPFGVADGRDEGEGDAGIAAAFFEEGRFTFAANFSSGASSLDATGLGISATTSLAGLSRRRPLKVTPLKGGKDAVPWPAAKDFAHIICAQMAQESPTKYLDTMSKKDRVGRIFLDYLRNDRSSTAVAVLSPRARAGAPISMPIHWHDVKSGLDPARYTIRTVPATPDCRYFVVRGRLWRLSNPCLPPEIHERFVRELMAARRAVRDARDAQERIAARLRVDAAKKALGERGRVWWDDGAPDYNRHLAVSTPYAEWFNQSSD